MGKLINRFRIILNYDWQRLFFELVVVFLGVTAGFFLNNWRMYQQEKELEQKYITAFMQDVENSIPDLEDFLEADSIWLARANPILKSIQNKNIVLDSAKVAASLITGISKMDTRRGTYEDITNSGNLNLITDFELKTLLVDYYIYIDGVGFIDDYFYRYFSDFVMPFIISEFNVLNGEFNNPGIIKSVRFANVTAGYFSMVQQRVAAYTELLDRSYKLRDELNKWIRSD